MMVLVVKVRLSNLIVLCSYVDHDGIDNNCLRLRQYRQTEREAMDKHHLVNNVHTVHANKGEK